MFFVTAHLNGFVKCSMYKSLYQKSVARPRALFGNQFEKENHHFKSMPFGRGIWDSSQRVEFTRILGPVGNGTPSKETPHPRTFGSPEMDGVTIRRVRPSVGKKGWTPVQQWERQFEVQLVQKRGSVGNAFRID